MNQYPPAPDPSSQPPAQYPQYPQHPQYAQPNPYSPPAGYAPPAPRRSALPLILAGIAAVIVIAGLVLVILRPFGGASASGTWYGAGSTGSTGDSAETFNLETYLNVTQKGSQLSGSGELCSLGTSNIIFSITGTLQGSALDMTWSITDNSPGGSGSADSEHVTGQLKGDALSLSSLDASGYYRSTLRHGDHAAFASACASVTA